MTSFQNSPNHVGYICWLTTDINEIVDKIRLNVIIPGEGDSKVISKGVSGAENYAKVMRQLEEFVFKQLITSSDAGDDQFN